MMGWCAEIAGNPENYCLLDNELCFRPTSKAAFDLAKPVSD